MTLEQIKELEELIAEYGVAVLCEGSSNRVRQAKRIMAHVETIAAAARAEAIEECAKKIEPKNSVEDWTEYAQARADAAADLRALLNTGEKT